MTVEEYREYEKGKLDFPFTFLLKSAERFGVDITELLTGDNPKLSFYTVVRRGQGPQIERRKGFEYRHLAYLMKNRMAEPFLVTAPYVEAEQNKPIKYSTHEGQEFDMVLKGSQNRHQGAHGSTQGRGFHLLRFRAKTRHDRHRRQ